MQQKFKCLLVFFLLAGILPVAVAQNCGSGFHGNWRVLGPDFSTQHGGYSTSVWADPSNASYILAGTYGGLFKSTDGGQHWACITDNAPAYGGIHNINSIAVDPADHNVIFLGTYSSWWRNDWNDLEAGVFGSGILKSTDGGQSWQFETLPISLDFGDSVAMSQKIYFTPNGDRLYAFSKDRVFTRSYPSGSWQDITPSGVSSTSAFYDLEFNPSNQSQFFISNMFRGSTGTGDASIWEATQAVPTSWNKITSSFTSTCGSSTVNATDWKRIEMSVPDGDTLFFVAMANQSNYCQGLYKYNITGSTHQITAINTALPTYGNPDFETLEMIATPIQSNNNNKRSIYFGSDCAFQSVDGGRTFGYISTYDPGPSTTETHCDSRGMFLQSATNSLHGVNDRLFISNDGGVSVKQPGKDVTVDGLNTMVNINGQGLIAGHFLSVSTSEDGGLVFGGMWHSGFCAYEPDISPNWKFLSGGDISTTMFDKWDRTKAWGIDAYNEKSYTVPGSGRKMNAAIGYTDTLSEKQRTNPPWAIDNEDRRYEGHLQLWTMPTSSSAWTPIGNLSPTNNGILALSHNPYTFSYNGYVLYYSPAKLFYRNPLFNSNFSEIGTYPADTFYNIYTVVCDPLHTERVWVGMKGINYPTSTNTQHRVYFSSDAGDHWTDVSDGLPSRSPVKRLAYDESRKVVYAATNSGIFRLDGTSTSTMAGGWECFSDRETGSNKFPNVDITGLEINYCQSKIYASTLGRGIWVSDLYTPSSTPTPGVSDQIVSAMTWTSDRFVTGSIDIGPGYSLTITGCTVHMPKNAYIYVHPGGKLVVNGGGKITNSCSECMWGGIKVIGIKNQNQSITTVSPLFYNQGFVSLNNATIEHAKIAIENSDGTNNNTGGVIQATNANFLNNDRAVYIHNYKQYTSSGGIYDYNARFTNCNFERNINCKVHAAMKDHVELREVKGVVFSGCNFYNRQGIYYGTGIGILATDASIKVNGGNFIKFAQGIWTEKTSNLDYISNITAVVFDSCSYGIRCLNDYHVSILNDSFKIGRGLDAGIGYDCNLNVGIYATGTHYPIIEENYFKGYDYSWQASAHENWGLIMDNCGQEDKEVYHCRFVDLDKGCMAWGGNKDGRRYLGQGIVSHGLKFTCNIFENNVKDIYIDGNGIAPLQGSSCSGITCYPAGNDFGATSSTYIENKGDKIYYFYEGPPSSTNYKYPNPTKIISQYAFPNLNGTIEIDAATGTNSCPSRGGVVLSSSSATKSAFYNASAALQAAKTNYDNLIDGGSTTNMVNFIQTTTDVNAVYTTLMSTSPYLSDDALRATAMVNILSTTQLKNVLIANPEMIRSEDLRNYICFTANALMPNEMDDVMGQIDGVFSARTEKEAEIVELGAQMDFNANRIIADLMMDSTGTDGDSIIAWYDNLNSVNAEYAKAGFYASRGDLSTADDVLGNLSSKFTLTTDQQNDYNAYMQYWNLVKSVKDDGRELEEMTTGETNSLQAIFDNAAYASVTKAAAGATLNVIFANLRLPCDAYAVSNWNTSSIKPGRPTPGNTKEDRLSGWGRVSAYPNPASDLVTFEYTLHGTANDRYIIVTDITGKQVKEIKLEDQSGKFKWDIHNTPAGVYLYKVQSGKTVLRTGKLVITK